MQLKASIEKLMHRQNLDAISCQQALQEMLLDDANPLQATAFLVLLRSKSETAEELTGMVKALQQSMIHVTCKHKVLDIVGTGGDGANTVNISTGSAILAASCGIKIAKHGNRAVSSQAGSADVLEALGVAIDLSSQKIAACIDEIGIGFCFSPNFHPAMRHLRQLRKQLNIPTTFNILGPLLNPANPAHLLLGVFNSTLVSIIATTLRQLGTMRSIVTHSYGLDEISCLGPAKLLEVTQEGIEQFIVDPETYGFNRCTVEDLQGGNAETNAGLLKQALSGKRHKKIIAIANTLIINAAVALYLYGQHSSINEAIAHAKDNLYSGKALAQLQKWIEFSHD